jgi:threonine dehydrogenase-like Zn-dependent dehydrogenase
MKNEGGAWSTMKAIVAYPPRENSARLIDVPVPEPKDGEVLLQIAEIGIDGTDREIDEGIYGMPPEGFPYLILGHEAVGKVVRAGSGVEGITIGSMVVPTVRRPDGCANCLAGESDMCVAGGYREHGIHRLHGFASEYAPSDHRFVIPVPEELRGSAVLLEPLSVAEKAIFQMFRIQSRMVWEPQSALVTGAGPLGLLTALALRLRGMEVSVAATRGQDSAKAQIVREMGGRYLNVRETPIRDLDREFDVIMEATGSVLPATEASHKLGRNGAMCFMGNYRDSGSWEKLNRFLYGLVLGNRLIFGSVNSNRGHFAMALRDLQEIQRRFPGITGRMITKRVPPEGFRNAFSPDREGIKTIIEFGESSGG